MWSCYVQVVLHTDIPSAVNIVVLVDTLGLFAHDHTDAQAHITYFGCQADSAWSLFVPLSYIAK